MAAEEALFPAGIAAEELVVDLVGEGLGDGAANDARVEERCRHRATRATRPCT